MKNKVSLTKKSIKTGRKNVIVAPRQSMSMSSYKSALIEPFSPNAIGARVPDMFASPTVTYHYKGTATIKSDSNGVASIFLTPVPYATIVAMDNASVQTSSATPLTNNTSRFFAGADPDNIRATLSSARVVGCGFRIRNLLPPNTATGRCIIAPLNICGTVPTAGALKNQQLLSGFFVETLTGLNTTSGGGLDTADAHFPSNILEIPTAQEYTIQELISNTITVACKPTAPNAFNFDNSNDVIVSGSATVTNNGQYFGNEVTSTTGSNNAINKIFSGQNAYSGWTAYAVRFEGLPASTSNAVEIEYIGHLEGTPPVGTAAGSITPIGAPVALVDLAGHQSVLSQALNSPAIRLIDESLRSAASGYITGGAAGAGINLTKLMMSKLGISL
jgi:hypothetical protein